MPSARQINWAKTRVTLVSLAAIAVLGELAYLLTGGSIFERESVVYLYIPDGTGLIAGAPMRVDGVPVGKVASVDLTGSNTPARVIRVAIEVERERLPRIPADSLAELSPDSLVGDMFVDVTGGRSSAPLRPGGEIQFKPQVDFVKTVDLTQFDQVLRDIDAALTDIEQGKSRVGQFVTGEAVYDDILKRVMEAQRGLRAATTATTEIGKAIETDEFYRKVSGPLADLEQSLERLQAARTGAGRLLNDPALYEQLRKSASDLRASIKELRASDFLASEAAYSAWNSRLQKLIDGVDRANSSSLFADSQWYERMDAAVRQFHDGLKNFREDPRKYLQMKVF
jgi:phospholipid/cholesterol/gamma-HCH transport system substrate-binding protein